jgi:hypothetical protein
MLIYSAQSSVVNPEPQGLSVWVTISEDDALRRSYHFQQALSLADKRINVAEASSRGQKESRGSVFKPSPETGLFTLTAIQSFSLNFGAQHNLNQNWQEGKTLFTRWGEPMSRHVIVIVRHVQLGYLGALWPPRVVSAVTPGW